MTHKTTAEPSALQQIIADAIDASDELPSRYAVAQACGWKPSHIYQRLTHPITAESLSTLFAAVDAVIIIGGLKYTLFLTENRQAGFLRTERNWSEE